MLSSIGYEILFLLSLNQGTVITRVRMTEFIEEKTGNYIEDNTVSVHMKRLREKLGKYDGHHGSIHALNHNGALFVINLPHKITKNKYTVTNE